MALLGVFIIETLYYGSLLMNVLLGIKQNLEIYNQGKSLKYHAIKKKYYEIARTVFALVLNRTP